MKGHDKQLFPHHNDAGTLKKKPKKILESLLCLI